MSARRILTILGLGAALTALSPDSRCDARTLEVNFDGSAEFIVLQDALSAAATGDTVLIHPGAYTNTTRRWHGGTYREAVGFIESGVTIMAYTYAATIRVPSSISPYSAVGLYSVTSDSFSVRTLRFQGETSAALAIQGGGPALVDSCQFDGTRIGVATGAPGSRGWIRRCEFLDTKGVLTAASGWSRAWGCTFVNPPGSINHVLVVSHSGSYAEMFDCTLENGSGVQVNTSARGLVRDFVGTGVATGALVTDPGSYLELERVFMEGRIPHDNRTVGLVNENRGNFVGRDVSVVNFYRAIELGDPGPTLLRNSHILNWELRAVHTPHANDPPHVTIDLRENWWGTTDSTAIAEAVWDSYDDPDRNPYATVEFWPVAPGPVPTRKESVGGLKGMYQPRRE